MINSNSYAIETDFTRENLNRHIYKATCARSFNLSILARLT